MRSIWPHKVIPFVPIAEAVGKYGELFRTQALSSLYESGEHLDQPPTSPIQNELTLAYTPLHGVGADAVETALKLAGFTQTYTAAQRQPDGHFPTVRFPNPEYLAMDAVLELAKNKERTSPWPMTLMQIDSLSQSDVTTFVPDA